MKQRRVKICRLTLFEAEFLSFVEQIGFGTAQIDDLRTSVAILLHDRAFSTVIGVGTARSTTNDTSALVRPVITFVTDAN